MDKPNLAKRKELAAVLLAEMKKVYAQLDVAASEVEKGSGTFYDEAYNEKHGELEAVMASYRSNVNRIREINNEITASINSWYDFTKDEKEMGKAFFPIVFYFRKKALYKKIKIRNGEISSITINNRFIKEQLTAMEHQLEIKAASLAHSGGNYMEYEKLLFKRKAIADELKYLLPTIPGACPADLGTAGIDRLLMEMN